jgi:hypothetical protein
MLVEHGLEVEQLPGGRGVRGARAQRVRGGLPTARSTGFNAEPVPVAAQSTRMTPKGPMMAREALSRTSVAGHTTHSWRCTPGATRAPAPSQLRVTTAPSPSCALGWTGSASTLGVQGVEVGGEVLGVRAHVAEAGLAGQRIDGALGVHPVPVGLPHDAALQREVVERRGREQVHAREHPHALGHTLGRRTQQAHHPARGGGLDGAQALRLGVLHARSWWPARRRSWCAWRWRARRSGRKRMSPFITSSGFARVQQ